ncbi:MAG TPA: hypothetical protein VMU34_16790 [Mycobacterium sp.]|nr:hypothetical protein [Mycobacterium sp.]
MSDNPHYNLKRRADAARAAADVSIDPAVHLVANALDGAVAAEQERIARAARERVNGDLPDPDAFPRHSEVTAAGTLDWYDTGPTLIEGCRPLDDGPPDQRSATNDTPRCG